MAVARESAKERADRELERIIDERDRLYDMRFKALETTFYAALAAQEKVSNSAIISLEKAILKSEEAQRAYNVHSNEFRGQLDDQAKGLMPRSEATSMHSSTNEKMEVVRLSLEGRIEELRLSMEKVSDGLAKDISILRESRSVMEGARSSQRELISYGFALIGILVAVAAVYFKAH